MNEINDNLELYKILLSTIETEDGIDYYAEFREFEFCSGCGDTVEEAVKDARANLANYISELKEEGKAIPEPITDINYSGKYALRLSKSMHKKAAECAAREGISLNSFIAEAVCEKVGSYSTNRVLTKLESTIDKFAEVVGFANPLLYVAAQINNQTVNRNGYRKTQNFILN